VVPLCVRRVVHDRGGDGDDGVDLDLNQFGFGFNEEDISEGEDDGAEDSDDGC
jgi:hypothetical protein